MTASITSDVPLSAVRGVDTRSTWMSRASRSRPTPTVKTGTAAAFKPRSASVSEASVVSAPSLTSTMPASGRPGQLLTRALERRPELGLRAGERQLRRRAEPRRR